MIDHSEERQRLIEDHCYLCARGARKFLRKGVDRNDLEQVAAVGLIKAADRYDAATGTPFEAYAWALILGELMHYVRDSERLLRAPRRVRELERRWLAAEGELWMSLGRNPDDSEVASMIGASLEEGAEVARYRENASVLSTDTLAPSEHRSLSYTIDEQLDRVVVETSLAKLTSLERTLLKEIYERDTPLLEIARRLGYSRRHLTRLHKSALQKLSSLARPQIA